MSENAVEEIELPRSGDAAFAGLMDALAPEQGEAEAGADGGTAGTPSTGGAPAAPAADGDTPGAPTAGAGAADGGGGVDGAGAPAGAGTAAAPDAGAADGGAGGADGPAAGTAGDRPADWTAAPADLTTQLGEISTAFETRIEQTYQTVALEEIQKEHAAYFDALNKHPRLMVGQQVPKLDGTEGFETLSSADDAREWQEAVKHILATEVRERATKQLEENADFLTTVHSSIDLFKNNADLTPGSNTFDMDLADRFVTIAAPYELRVEGKLQGYSIPVQPIIDQLREQLIKERAAASPAASAAGAAASTPAAPAAPAKPAAAPPQAGIPSKAGSTDEKEDFSTLFGTIGMPDFRI